MERYYDKEIGICCECGEKIFAFDEHRTTGKGLIHEECLKDVLDELWRNMSDSEKYELLNERGMI